MWAWPGQESSKELWSSACVWTARSSARVSNTNVSTLFCIAALDLHGVGINDGKVIKAWVVLPQPGCYCNSRALPKSVASFHVWAIMLTQGITLVCPSLLNELSWILVTSLSVVLDGDSILNCGAWEYATDDTVEALKFLTFLSSKAVTCLRGTPSSTPSLRTYNYLKLLFPLRFLPKPIPVC